jgi:hypothetical protein
VPEEKQVHASAGMSGPSSWSVSQLSGVMLFRPFYSLVRSY